MTQHLKMGRAALWFLPLALVAGGFIAAIPWLRTLDSAVAQLIAVTVGISVLAYSWFFSIRSDRTLDEVQRAGGLFAWRWGSTAGMGVFALLLLLPPFRDLLTAIVNGLIDDPEIAVPQKAVVLAVTLGMCGVALLQVVGTFVMAVIWWARTR